MILQNSKSIEPAYNRWEVYSKQLQMALLFWLIFYLLSILQQVGKLIIWTPYCHQSHSFGIPLPPSQKWFRISSIWHLSSSGLLDCMYWKLSSPPTPHGMMTWYINDPLSELVNCWLIHSVKYMSHFVTIIQKDLRTQNLWPVESLSMFSLCRIPYMVGPFISTKGSSGVL